MVCLCLSGCLVLCNTELRVVFNVVCLGCVNSVGLSFMVIWF